MTYYIMPMCMQTCKTSKFFVSVGCIIESLPFCANLRLENLLARSILIDAIICHLMRITSILLYVLNCSLFSSCFVRLLFSFCPFSRKKKRGGGARVSSYIFAQLAEFFVEFVLVFLLSIRLLLNSTRHYRVIVAAYL